MKRNVVGAVFALFSAALVSAQTTAYVVPSGTVGNQDLSSVPQSLGMDFEVNSPISITSLGVFDSGGDGLVGPLRAHIYNRDTQASLASLDFTTNQPGTLVGGSRFQSLSNALVLPQGFHGTVVVDYLTTPTEPNGNWGHGAGSWTTDSGGGLISFVGSARTTVSGIGYPNVADAGPANRYAAGTFVFAAVNSSGSLVVPRTAENTHMPYGAGAFRDSYRYQQVYGSAEFPAGPIWIRELRFRPDATYGAAFATTVANIQFNLSTTARNPNALSSVFAENVGANDTVVFHGALSISSQFTGPAGGPKVFDILVPLSQPFFYDPSAGALVVDIRNFSGSGASLTGGQTGPDSAWRIFAGIGATSGVVDTGADAIRIVYSPATNLQPAIVAQPQSQTVASGTTVTFAVGVSGSSPLSYWWLRNGAVIEGATAVSLSLSGVQPSDAGSYSVVVSNAYGVATSQAATLTVVGAPGPTLVVPRTAENTHMPYGAGAFRDTWRYQQVYGSAEFPAGPIWIRELRFRPDATYGAAFATTVANIQFNLSTTARNPNALSSVFAENVGANDTVVFHGALSISSQFIGPAGGPKVFDILVPLSQPFFYDPSAGALVVDIRNFSGSGASLTGGQTGPDSAGRVMGTTVTVTSGVVDTGADAIQIVYSPATNLPPAIVTQPQSRSVIEGASVTFTVGVSGSGPLSYQWFKGGAVIDGATASALTLNNVQLSQSGNYSVVVSNAYGVATSQNATLNVSAAPDYDLSRQFSLNGNPNGVWSYGWQGTPGGAFTLFTHSKIAYDSAGAPVETWDKPDSVPAVQHNNGTSTVVTGYGGNFPPETTWFYPGVEGHPENFGVIRFTVPGGGSGTYDLATTVRPVWDSSYQLDTDFHVLKNGVELFGRALAGTASAGYTNSLALAAGDTIDFVIGRGADDSFIGSGLKITATLDLASTNPVPPAIVAQPQSQTVASGTTVTFAVGVSGSSPLSYWWLRNGAVIEGATAVSLSLSGVQPSDAGSYSVVVSNAYGVATSQAATLTVVGAPGPTLVVPRTAENTHMPYGAGAFRDTWRYQQVYGSAEFPAGPIWIRELRFRPDATYGAAFATTVANIQFNLSTTARNPNALSSVFAENVGANDTVVFHGALSISSQFIGPAGGPKVFDILVPLSQPFFYDPSAGALVVDIRNFSGSGASLTGGQTGPDSAGRVMGTTVTVTSGVVDTGADAIQIVYSPATNLPPAIVTQPQSRSVIEGASVTFTVGVSGSGPLSYQWFKGGAVIDGATASALTLNNVQLSQSGNYSVVVSNAYGVATSQNATLNVSAAPDYDLSRQFSLNGNPNGVWSYGRQDVLGGEFTLLGTAKTNYDAQGIPVELWAINLPSQPAILHNASGQTASGYGWNFAPGETWFAPGPEGQPGDYAVARFTVPSTAGGTYLLQITARPAYSAGVQRDTDFHVLRNNVEMFGAALNGEQIAGYTNSIALLAGDTIDFAVGRGADNSYISSGLKVEATLDTASTNPVPPTIVSQPASQTVDLGTTVSLGVGVRGSLPLSYQWRFNGINLPHGTNSTLVLEFAQQANAGQYQVIVSNAYGSATSTVATVTVQSSGVAPTISSQPTGAQVLAGSSVTLNVQAVGTAPLNYKWYYNGMVVTGATSATLTLANAQPNQSGSYWVTVSNAFGVATSRSATVNIWESTQGGTVLFGNSSSNLIYDVDGITPVPAGTSYLVQLYAGPDGSSLAPVGAAIGFAVPGRFPTGVRTISSVPAGQVATVQVKVWETAYGATFEQALAAGGKTGASDVFTTPTGGTGSPPSLPVPLTGLRSFALAPGVGAVPPEITSHPVSQTIQLGQSASFSVTASGPAPLLYQWRLGGSPLAGQTGTTLSITNAQNTHAGAYTVVVRNGGGAVTSQVATLTVETSRVLMTKALGSVTEGDLVAVPIDLKSEGDVAGMSFVLRYNPDFLSSPSVEWSSALDGALKEVNETALGELRFVFAFGSGTLAAGTQSVATVNLRARSVIANAGSQLALQILDISDASGDPIIYGSAAESGSVVIEESTALAGDNNANGRLDVGDATLVLRLLALLDTTRPWDVDQNDLNNNGVLDSGDAVKILRAVAGIGAAPAAAAAQAVTANAGSGFGAAFLTPGTASANPGSLVSFQVRLQGLENPVAGASFTVNYPANVLRLRGAQDHRAGSLVPQSAAPVWNVGANGQIRFAASSSTSWPANNGVLAELTFEVKNPPTGEFAWPITLSNVEVTSDGYELNALGSASATFSVQPLLSALIPTASGSVTFNFSSAGGSYVVEASTNLLNWVALTNVVGAIGPVYVADPQAQSFPRRFYRARIIE